MLVTIPTVIKTTKKVPGCNACGKRIRTKCVFVAIRHQEEKKILVGKMTAPRTMWHVIRNYHFHPSCIKLPSVRRTE